MEIKITSENQNPMLKRKEVTFEVDHGQAGSTPSRSETKKAIAAKLKASDELVFVRKFETKTGTRTAVGYAHIYDTADQARLVEPEYIVKRNFPPEKPKEEAKA